MRYTFKTTAMITENLILAARHSFNPILTYSTQLGKLILVKISEIQFNKPSL